MLGVLADVLEHVRVGHDHLAKIDRGEAQREALAAQTMENSQQWQQDYQAKVRNDDRRVYETIQRSNDLHTANQAVIQDESDIRNAQNSEDLQRALNNYQRDVQERKEIEDR